MNKEYLLNTLSPSLEYIAHFRKTHQDLIRVAQSISDASGYADELLVTDNGTLNMPPLLALARSGLWNDPSLEHLNVAGVDTVSNPWGTEVKLVWNQQALNYPDYFLFIHSGADIPESAAGPGLHHQTALIIRVVDGYVVGVVAADYANYINTIELYPYILFNTLNALAPRVLVAKGAQLVMANTEYDMNSKSNLEIPVMILRSSTNLQQYESTFKSIQIMDLVGLCQTWTLASAYLLVQLIRSNPSDDVIPQFIRAYKREFSTKEGMQSHISIFDFLLYILKTYALRNNITIRKSPVRRTSDGDIQMIDRDTGEVAVKYRNNKTEQNVMPKSNPYRRKSLDMILGKLKRKRENGLNVDSRIVKRRTKRL